MIRLFTIPYLQLNVPSKTLCGVLLVWFEAFRRLGFTPDELFVQQGILDAPSGSICWGWTLRVAGVGDWHQAVGSTDIPDDNFVRVWLRYTKHTMPKITDAEMQPLWEQYMPEELLIELAAYLMHRGFPIRNMPKGKN